MWWRVPRRGNSVHLKLKIRENSKYPIRGLTGVRGQARLLNEDTLWLNNSKEFQGIYPWEIIRQMFIPALLMTTKYWTYNTCLACRGLIIDFSYYLDFSLFLPFSNLTMICVGVDLFVFILLCGSLSFLKLVD